MAGDRLDVSAAGFLGTAAQHVVSRIPVAGPKATVASMRRSLVDTRFDSVACVAICEDRELVGLLDIEVLLAAPGKTAAAEVMDTDPPVVSQGTDQEAAAWTAVRRGETSLAVVDDHGAFVGLIPPEKLIAILLEEHDEDMARLGGFLKGVTSAQLASRERVSRRLWHRLPWLMVGLVGAFLAAEIVGAFEDQLQRNVVLAFFLPGIAYMAGAVASQTQTLVVRGLSVGVSIREVVRRELITGLFIGLAIALAFAPVGLWRWGEADVVVAIAIALFAACSTAALVAIALPWTLHRLGFDPAFGSGPLATVLQDLLSVLIYLSVAMLVVD